MPPATREVVRGAKREAQGVKKAEQGRAEHATHQRREADEEIGRNAEPERPLMRTATERRGLRNRDEGSRARRPEQRRPRDGVPQRVPGEDDHRGMRKGHGDGTTKSRVTATVAHEDGTASCRIHVPVGHPTETFHEADGTALEMDHELEFIVGLGITNLRAVDPVTREETAVGGNLLDVSATNPEVHVGTWATAERWRRSTGPSATSRR